MDVSSFDDPSTLRSVRQKVVLVGDVSVGKTSIINRFIDNKFNETYNVCIIIFYHHLQPSIGVDFCSKQISFEDKCLKLQIWDSAGQERYKSLIPSYVKGAAIVFIVFDVTSMYVINNFYTRSSFENLKNWINFIKNIESSILVLCGNKVDLKR
jgi:small GTP-binding protein